MDCGGKFGYAGTRSSLVSQARGAAHELAPIPPYLIDRAAPQPRPYLDGQALEPYRVSVNADLVELHAAARDRQDGVLQTIGLFRHEDIPVTVGLVGDHSGSMRQTLPDVVADDVGIAEYRDSYRVLYTRIVSSGEVAVLNPDGNEILTLGHLFSFYFVGSAPDRFIVRTESVLRTT